VSKAGEAYWLAVVITGLCSIPFVLSSGGPPTRNGQDSACICWPPWPPPDQGAVARIFSTLSMNYVFVIAGLSDLHLAGGIVICFAT